MSSSPSQVGGAARVVEVQKVEVRVLGIAGAGLLGLAGVFLWRELHVAPEVLMLVGALLAAGLAWFFRRTQTLLVGPVVLLGATALGGLWYGATREPLLLAALAVLFAVSLAMAVGELVQARPESALSRWHRMLSWHGVALSGLATTFALYFHVFDASDLAAQDFVARRALLTLGWLLAGVGLVLFGRARRATEVRDAGFVVLAASVGKLLVYDTTHLDGLLRVGALAVGGLVLLTSAQLARRFNAGRS